MEANQTNTQEIIETKQYIALVAVLFLAPAIDVLLKNNDIILTTEEQEFTNGYMQYGKHLLFGLLAAWLIRALWYFTQPIFKDIGQWVAGITLLASIFGIYSIFRKTPLIENKKIKWSNIKSLFKLKE